MRLSVSVPHASASGIALNEAVVSREPEDAMVRLSAPVAVACMLAGSARAAVAQEAGFAEDAAQRGMSAQEVAQALDELRAANAALAAQNAALSGKVDALERSVNGDDWLTGARVAEIRGIVGDMLADAGDRVSLSGDAALAGWDPAKRGFHIDSADGSMRLSVMGQVQARWAGSFKRDAGLPADAPETDEWGFEMRRVRVFFGGHVVDPSWTFQFAPAWARGASLQSKASKSSPRRSARFLAIGSWLQARNLMFGCCIFTAADLSQGRADSISRWRRTFLQRPSVPCSSPTIGWRLSTLSPPG